ncbi:hypothetical protein Tco_1139271 [Tanacetum coccineum]
MIKRSKSENKGIVPTEMELVLEQTQQGTSHEVSNIQVIPKYHSEDGNPARANIKQALRRRLKLSMCCKNVHLKMEMEMEIPCSSKVKIITTCSYSSNTYVEIMKVQEKVSMLSQTLVSTSSSACQSNEVMM